MSHPFITLGIHDDADDAEVRRAYHQRLREFPPERDAARFQEVTEAHQAVKDEVGRARIRLFGSCKPDNDVTSLFPAARNARQRIGMNLWQKAMTENPNG